MSAAVVAPVALLYVVGVACGIVWAPPFMPSGDMGRPVRRCPGRLAWRFVPGDSPAYVAQALGDEWVRVRLTGDDWVLTGPSVIQRSVVCPRGVPRSEMLLAAERHLRALEPADDREAAS